MHRKLSKSLHCWQSYIREIIGWRFLGLCIFSYRLPLVHSWRRRCSTDLLGRSTSRRKLNVFKFFRQVAGVNGPLVLTSNDWCCGTAQQKVGSAYVRNWVHDHSIYCCKKSCPFYLSIKQFLFFCILALLTIFSTFSVRKIIKYQSRQLIIYNELIMKCDFSVFV